MKGFAIAFILLFFVNLAFADMRDEAKTVLVAFRQSGISQKMPEEANGINSVFNIAESFYEKKEFETSDRYFILAIQMIQALMATQRYHSHYSTLHSTVQPDKNPLTLRLAPKSEITEQQPAQRPAALKAEEERESAAGKTETAPDRIWDLYLAAKANDPLLGRAEARVTGSKADSDMLFATLLPHLDSNIGVQRLSQTLLNYNISNDPNYDFTSLHYNITARMTLLHIPTIFSLSSAAAGVKVEEAGLAAARQNLMVKFTDSYFALLKAQTDKRIVLGEIKRLKKVLDQAQAFLKEGTGDIIAVYEAQARLDGAHADLTKSESALQLAEQKLSSVTGKTVTTITDYLPRQPARPEPDNLEWWVATMEKENPILRQANEGLTQTAEQRKAVKAEYLPVLQVSGGYDVNKGTAALPTAEVRQWFIGASVSLPLYSGGETSAKIRRAVASEEERRYTFNETINQLRENVTRAFLNLHYNRSYINALEQKIASAEIQLAAVNKGRGIGTRNAVDVLNAEQSYSIALRDYKYAIYDNVCMLIQLKSAAGILAEDDVFKISRDATPSQRGQADLSGQ